MNWELGMWMGKPICTMERSELIEALGQCFAKLAEFQSSEAMMVMALGRVELIKRGEK
jgi:hypothetical protein